MKIIIAKTAGFCMGVRRAVDMVLEAPGKQPEPIHTFGPLIHNPQVLDLLEEKGIHSLDAIPREGAGTTLIRAHGVPPEAQMKLEAAGFKVINATCPRVIRVQTIIRKHSEKGYASIIIGDSDHPEVIGLKGYAGDRGYVVNSLAELAALPAFEHAIIVAQTTQNTEFYDTVKKWAADQRPHYKVYDTICDSTRNRQAEISQLADHVDAIIVVGGRNSGNTIRLAEIARQTGKPTYHIETEEELDLEAFAGAETIGITAGASTPNWVIRKICRVLEMIPASRLSGWKLALFNLQRALLLTNIYVAVGAGCLCYACTRLLGSSQNFPHVLIAVLYVLSMHILNNLTGKKSDHYNDPVRARFYESNRYLLGMLALLAGGVGLATASSLGSGPFFVLLAMSVTGLSYNLNLVPSGFRRIRYRRIKDIPGSKTVLIAVAWGVVTAILPALHHPESVSGLAAAAVFTWSTCMVFVRTTFFDLLDIQGDRIVGKETIPVAFGEKQSQLLLKIMLIVGAATLAASAAFNTVPWFGYLLALCPLLFLPVAIAHQQGRIMPGIRLEFIAESLFVLTGFLAFTISLVA
jgi:(E)-4-hydroxy-3-methyl-but-2-enyl pyrophosphate reductase